MAGPIAEFVELQNLRADLVQEFGPERATEIEERARRYFNKPDTLAEALREELSEAIYLREERRKLDASRPWEPAELLDESKDWIQTAKAPRRAKGVSA